MKIVAIVGSIRKDSYNLKLAKYIQKRYQDRFELEILNLRELPFYDQDIEMNPPEVVKNFKQKVASSDAVLWVTPEYNGTIPGVLGNAIDWLSRVDKVMIGKPSWIVGASMGNLGTVKAQLHLRDILFAAGISSPLLPGNEVYVGAVHEKLDETGELTHEPTVQFLDTVVDHFIDWITRIS
ncbi:NAD(P)H-dependent oxidoreductase [Peribacillus psychrosaccharolyticus]|uniref:NAD(P)H-dependent oxidoreductase n=1 Tax=Peribacillus psychrosaccharolyticus TaxID=1407 RepID=A0A974S1Z4_PERPY|nr:NAD(P)H-dependent oxidoreductase [Peribacillus psychrosaccharolyticus]MEC2055984.1 NAD(P)H-dependent oxidoreductase [Peribacillus psychrosaccharolyticus]MED3743158.1 NAD(P)H-dependent oxidoreductase [Peribacillus psychrosaccharolyticus]QQT00805.1 NAD(P)H-dependent oxidoreductase [Peribacillus psychrosaccharolyticus]